MKRKFKFCDRLCFILLFLSVFISYDIVSADQTKKTRDTNIDETLKYEEIVIIDNDKAIAKFFVEVVSDKERRQKGLMHRKKLNINNGMLFDFKKKMNVTFWMKDTF